MDKNFVFVLAAIAVLGAWTIRPQTTEQARQQAWNSFDMDKCHRKMSAALMLDVDGARYNVDELCKTARKIDAMTGGR